MFTVIVHDSGEMRRFALAAGETLVGRAPTCGLILKDTSVSRVHARLSVLDEQCVITDLSSRNGTFKGGNAITSATLRDGDVVVLGAVPLGIEQSAADRLILTDDHEILDSPRTIVRSVATASASSAAASVPDGRRLLDLLSEISRTLVRPQPVSDVLERVVDLVFDTVAAQRAVLILSSETGGELVPRVVRCRGRANPGSTTISRTIVKNVLAERVAILGGDVQLDTKLQTAESIVSQTIRSYMCAPLWNHDEVIGALYTDAPKMNAFSPGDLDVFTALSNYAAVAIEQARLSTQLLQETRRRERLQRYHSPAVVDRILQAGDEADAPFMAQERDLTVLFADIVGFTTVAEQFTPGEVARLLNEYLGCMTSVIFEYEGTLDKFIGDAVMAVFGAPIDQPDHARRAVDAARKMRAAVDELNRRRDRPIELRIAINSGVALAGDMGSPMRREYTVLGDVVNTASRLEGIAPPGAIIISRPTYERLRGEVRAENRGFVSLRGRAADVEIFEVTG